MKKNELFFKSQNVSHIQNQPLASYNFYPAATTEAILVLSASSLSLIQVSRDPGTTPRMGFQETFYTWEGMLAYV